MGDKIKGRILFVANDVDSCETLSTLLKIAGYQTTFALNISETFQYVRNQDFDLILLSLYRGEGTGMDLCRLIRAENDQIPIFFYTDISGARESTKALEAGAQGYFIKPVDIGNLLQSLENQGSPLQS